MVDRLTSEDLQYLETYKRLVEYVVEQPHNGGSQCARLKTYRDIAQKLLIALNGIDQSVANQPTQTILPKDEQLREKMIALVIGAERGLLGMLKSQDLVQEKEHICAIYARMVMGHERDQDLKRLLEGLKNLRVLQASSCG